MDDLISRKQAIRIASGYCHWTNIPAELAKLPSVIPKHCTDAISRQAVLDLCERFDGCVPYSVLSNHDMLPSVSTEKTGRCKDCKYFEYDSVAKVDGIPLIVAHEICSKWGDGCKTSEDGYCFLFEPQPYKGESEDNG